MSEEMVASKKYFALWVFTFSLTCGLLVAIHYGLSPLFAMAANGIGQFVQSREDCRRELKARDYTLIFCVAVVILLLVILNYSFPVISDFFGALLIFIVQPAIVVPFWVLGIGLHYRKMSPG